MPRCMKYAHYVTLLQIYNLAHIDFHVSLTDQFTVDKLTLIYHK